MIQDTALSSNPFRYFWNLGYTRLCPIIPPGAPIHPGSSIRRRMDKSGQDPRGKSPGVLTTDGWRGFDFVSYEPEERDCDAWCAMGASVGIKTGRGLVAVDIDTTDSATALRLYKLAEDMLGPAPLRFGRKPKALLLYRVTDDIPYDSVLFSTPSEQDPKARPRVEILAEGRQFVAHGPHPGTGKPYIWPRGLPSRDDLTLIRPDQLNAYMTAVETSTEAPKRLGSASLTARGSLDQEALRGDPELVRQAVNNLPNTSEHFESRQDYLRVGYAIRAAMGPGLEDEGLDLFQQWAGRWTDGVNDPEVVAEDWARMPGPYAVGASWLYAKAEALGGWTGASTRFFAPLPEADQPTPTPKQKKRVEILRIRDIKELPDPVFMIDRHLPEASLGFLYGDPGCGKSFVALDWALHIAYGLPDWHGDAIRVRPGGNVLYLAREGSSGFKARIAAWQKKHPFLPDDILDSDRFGLIRQTINFVQPDDIKAIVDAVRAADMTPLDLIVVDTVSRALAGVDENLQASMTLFVAACDALQDAFACSVLGVHHAGKSGDMRGSTVLRGAGDCVFHLTKDKPGFARLTCEKQKDAPDGWHDDYRLETVDLGEGASSLVPRRLTATEIDEATTPLDDSVKARILEAMEAAWTSGDPWAIDRRGNRRKALDVMTDDFGLAEDEAGNLLRDWTRSGVVNYAAVSSSSKKRGYRVMKKPERQPDTGVLC